MPPFLVDLIRLADRCVALFPLPWERLRIAISPGEEAQLRDYAHKDRNEAFVSGVRGILLVVEEHPSDPLFRYEPVPDGGAPFAAAFTRGPVRRKEYDPFGEPVQSMPLKPPPCDMKSNEPGVTTRDLLGAKPVPEPPPRALPIFPHKAMKE